MAARSHSFLVLFASIAIVGLPGLASAQINSLLRVSGIPGNSMQAGLEDFIEINDFAVSAGDAGQGVEYRPLEVTKPSDATDTEFFERLVKGTGILGACALSYTTNGPTAEKRSAIAIGDVRVVNMTPTSTSTATLQSLTLSYTKISIISYLYDVDTGAPAGQQAYCWDVAANATCGNDLLSCPVN